MVESLETLQVLWETKRVEEWQLRCSKLQVNGTWMAINYYFSNFRFFYLLYLFWVESEGKNSLRDKIEIHLGVAVGRVIEISKFVT